MAIIAAQHVISAQGGEFSAYLGAFLHDLSVDYWPAYTIASGTIGKSVLTRKLPVDANPRMIASQATTSFVDDFYHRIHIRPAALALGNVVSTQTSVVKVWNAWFVPQTLTGISGTDDGVTAVGSGSLPMLFGALQEKIWHVSVTPDGPAVLDMRLTWDFSGVPSPSLPITGNRIIAWTLTPDWADGVTERLAWLTDIQTSPSGAEQRRAIRLSPRRTFEARMLATRRERALLDLTLYGWGARIFAVPVWHDQQWLKVDLALGVQTIRCDTTHRDFRERGLALLLGDNAFIYETVEVVGLTAVALTLARPTMQAWPAGSRLFPVRNAQLVQQPIPKRQTDQTWSLEVAFRLTEACDWPEIFPALLYRTVPVLEALPDESDELTAGYQRLVQELDNSAGMVHVTDTAQRAFVVQSYRWLLHGRADQAAFRSLLYALRGRQKIVWLPTHADDLRLVATVTPDATTIDIEYVGYTRFAKGQPGRRDIRLSLSDGTVLYRRIVSATEISNDVERLVIDAPLGRLTHPMDVARISYMVLCRLDQDDIELLHETDSDGVAKVQTVFRGIREDS
ncbi:hypothetical protein [Glaciimonas immobilis]|uniref:Phage tail protein n=1 Tax=Glaciimonas immobilis TaxID=728004 RepID=A0A840RPD3_9BURK|nr:hypothetical protein [Glaciimonas immobilis]KAF3999069.1 hypothetical protein HAV38_03750 [Glaciimonas immobilis]MBB5198500.1 hypothetical protein [Glaciimonas immobilis]